MSDPRLTLDEIEALTRSALVACGASGAQLDAATASVVDAEAEGIRIVGLGFLSIYCDQLKAGKIDGNAIPEITQIAPARLRADARNGFSHAAFLAALPRWLEMARDQGAAVLTVDHSNSAGVVGWFVEKAAREGLLCLGFANSSPMMPGPGGRKPFFGTNPLAFAAPRSANNPPLVIDMATAQVAYVAIKERADKGLPLPPGWGLDSEGNPTEDANAVINGGMNGPLGGAKGALLALIVDVLAGGLAGPSFSFQSSSIVDDLGGPMGIGQCFIAIDPQSTDFTARLDAMLAAMSETGSDRIPGARRDENRTAAEQDGIAVPQQLLNEIRAYACEN